MTRLLRGAHPENFSLEGVSLFAWIDMFNSYTHTHAWPDGGSMLSQPAITVSVFNVIESQHRKLSKRAVRDQEALDG